MGSQISASLSWPLSLQTPKFWVSESFKLEMSVLKASVLKLTTRHNLSSVFSGGPGCNCWPYGSLQVNSSNFLSFGVPQMGIYVLKPKKGSFRLSD